MTVPAAQTDFFYQSDFLSGFDRHISGEIISYYSRGAQALEAMLVRSLDAGDFIEWETQPVPVDAREPELRFVLLASLQVTADAHAFDVYLNGAKYFSFSNPVQRSLRTIQIAGRDQARMEFSDLEYDRFEDLTGFLFLHLPAKNFPAGKPIRIRVVGESAGSRSWFMVFKHPCRSQVSLSNENVVLNSAEQPRQSLRVKIFHMKPPEQASIIVGRVKTRFELKCGFNYFNAGVDHLDEEKELPIEFNVGKKTIGRTTQLFKPVKPLTIYLLSHSHVDIGYTHVQDDVRKLQWQHIEDAIELSERTANYPEGARFIWNTEVLWAVDSYLAAADAQKRRRFSDAVRNGRLGIDGLYANMLTGLCSPEEWTWLMEALRQVRNLCRVNVESAMICDVPGWSWSLAPMLAQAGIKYLSCGINQGDRIGSLRTELGDKPFYWLSPSGKEKVLTWVHEQGYSAFHYVPRSGSSMGLSVIEPTIINYANKLADEKYPYELAPLHYTIGSDNGPVDPYLADHVKEWNEKFASPKLIIASTAEFFKEFEKRYARLLPEKSGDITPYWEDGAASSAHETALNRQSAGRLSQAMKLFAQYAPALCPIDSFAQAWRNVILYDEHTWGSWNSVSEPESDFTLQQWRVKQSFALDAARQADELLHAAQRAVSISSSSADALEVINLAAIPRTELAHVPDGTAARLGTGMSLVDQNGMAVPVQELSDGTLVFLAADVPAWGSRRYFIEKSKRPVPFKPAFIDDRLLGNEFFTLELDLVRGILTRMVLTGSDHNLIDVSNPWGLGGYLYVNGRKPDHPVAPERAVVEIKEKGPLVSSWSISLTAPGCHSVQQEIRVIAGINRLEINYAIDKQKIYTPEAVRVAFPFNIPNGIIHIEHALGFYQPEAEQINGSCKNFFTLNHSVAVANAEYGVTLVSPDAPLVEVGGLSNDASAVGWLEKCLPGTSLYSLVMNNYWHTNYCAAQEGKSNYRYVLYPHQAFNPVDAVARGLFVEQPLVVLPTEKNAQPVCPRIRYNNEHIFIISMQPLHQGQALWLALYNVSAAETQLQLDCIAAPKQIYASDLLQSKLAKANAVISMPGRGITYLLVEW